MPDSSSASGRRTPRAGEIFKNPALAMTLGKVASGGCEEFYNGSIAQAYVDSMFCCLELVGNIALRFDTGRIKTACSN